MTNLKNRLEQIQSLVGECLLEISSMKSKSSLTPKKLQRQGGGNIIAIVNKIKNCSECDKIEKNILDKVGMPGRIILPFYICHKYFPQEQLTTGDVEKITKELGVKVITSNISNAIKNDLHKYLESGTTRVKGAKTYYKLNRRGLIFFESLLM